MPIVAIMNVRNVEEFMEIFDFFGYKKDVPNTDGFSLDNIVEVTKDNESELEPFSVGLIVRNTGDNTVLQREDNIVPWFTIDTSRIFKYIDIKSFEHLTKEDKLNDFAQAVCMDYLSEVNLMGELKKAGWSDNDCLTCTFPYLEQRLGEDGRPILLVTLFITNAASYYLDEYWLDVSFYSELDALKAFQETKNANK